MKILICGVGAVGSNLTARLAADLKGEHNITVLDMDKVEERNVQAGTQFYLPDQIGLSKVEALQYNIYKNYQREIEVLNGEFGTKIPTDVAWANDLVIDCFDNYTSRKLIHDICRGEGVHCLHIGFSANFTFAIEWAENYKVPSDIKGLDICELPGASAFVNHVASLGALVAEGFILDKDKIDIVGGKLHHTIMR